MPRYKTANTLSLARRQGRDIYGIRKAWLGTNSATLVSFPAF